MLDTHYPQCYRDFHFKIAVVTIHSNDLPLCVKIEILCIYFCLDHRLCNYLDHERCLLCRVQLLEYKITGSLTIAIYSLFLKINKQVSPILS